MVVIYEFWAKNIYHDSNSDIFATTTVFSISSFNDDNADFTSQFSSKVWMKFYKYGSTKINFSFLRIEK